MSELPLLSPKLRAELPPPLLRRYLVTTSFSLAETESSFNTYRQNQFKTGLVTLMNSGAGAGTITTNDITLAITPGSINVDATVTTYSESVLSSVSSSMTNVNSATASSVLGVTVLSVSAPVTGTTAHNPPPQPPGAAASGSDDETPIVPIVAACGGFVVLVIVIICILHMKRKVSATAPMSSTPSKESNFPTVKSPARPAVTEMETVSVN